MGKANYSLLLLQEKDAFNIFISFILPSLSTSDQITTTDLTLIHANSSVCMCIIKIAIKKSVSLNVLPTTWNLSSETQSRMSLQQANLEIDLLKSRAEKNRYF